MKEIKVVRANEFIKAVEEKQGFITPQMRDVKNLEPTFESVVTVGGQDFPPKGSDDDEPRVLIYIKRLDLEIYLSKADAEWLSSRLTQAVATWFRERD